MRWRDATSYSRGGRGTAEPTIWELDVDGLRVVVHRWHGLEGWFLSCHAMGVDKSALAATALESAQNEALIILRGKAKRWHDKLAAAIGGKP